MDDAITDYLKLIWERGVKHINQHAGADFLDVYALKVVLTVPAAWEPRAKDRTLQAAKKAGIPGEIDIVSEPEAAALSTLINMKDDEELQVRRPKRLKALESSSSLTFSSRLEMQ